MSNVLRVNINIKCQMSIYYEQSSPEKKMGGKRNKPSSDSGLTKETSLSKKTEGVGKENECFLCGAPGAELCKACGVVAACPLHTSHHQVAILNSLAN